VKNITYIDKSIVGVGMEEIINSIFLYSGFIIWFCYLYIIISKEIIVFKKIDNYWEYFKDNLFEIFRFDILILLIVFYYYSKFNNIAVSIYLFDAMMLFLLVNLLYENINIKKIEIYKNKIYYIISFIIGIIPVIYYFQKKDINYTLLMIFFIIYLYPLIFILLKKIFKKNKKNFKINNIIIYRKWLYAFMELLVMDCDYFISCGSFN